MDVESEFQEMCRGMAADELVEAIGRMREAGVVRQRAHLGVNPQDDAVLVHRLPQLLLREDGGR